MFAESKQMFKVQGSGFRVGLGWGEGMAFPAWFRSRKGHGDGAAQHSACVVDVTPWLPASWLLAPGGDDGRHRLQSRAFFKSGHR